MSRLQILERKGPITLLATDVTQPTSEERRQAVCMAMAWAPGLIRFAARYTHSIEDAEDAYQRGMEVALTSAPVTDPDQLITWLHTIIRREAAVIARTRRREEPTRWEELDETITARAEQPASPDAVVEWRERYRGLQDAWSGLTDAQKVCVMLRSTGVTRPEIQLITGFSERKVHREIAEGRARLTEWEVRMATGEECVLIFPLIDSVIDGSAGRRDRRVLSRHVGHCPACRASFRGRRDQLRLLGSLVPTALLGGQLMQAGPPDPGLALTWWDRVSASATLKSAHAVQVMMDIPALATSKAGAGAIAAAAASVVGTPMVIDAVHSRRSGPPVTAQVPSVTPTTPFVSPTLAPAPVIRPLPARTRAATPSKATVRVVTPRRPATGVKARPVAVATTHLPKPNTLEPSPRLARNSTASLEFEP